jgi:hypothetical protein
MKITGHIKLKSPLTVKSDCLNKEFNFMIGSLLGKLITPKLPEDSGGLKTGQNLEEPGLERFFNEEIFWGRVIQWSDGRSHIYNFKIEFDVDDESNVEDVGNRLYEGLPKWSIRFRDNLSVFGHDLELPTVNQNEIEAEKEYFDFFYKGPEGAKRPFTPTSVLNITIIGDTGIEFQDLHHVITITSENKRPILELGLLREANIALLEENYRKSILDSSTALELALTNCLRREIKIGQPLLDELLKLNNSISKKRNLLKIVGIALPNHNYVDDLETLRNRAIHIGKEPNDEEARKAFFISKEVIDLLCVEKFE